MLEVLRAIGGIRQCMGIRGVLGASRECRYSGAKRGIGGIRAIGGSKRCWRLLGMSGGVGSVKGVLEGWQGV